MIQLPDLLHLLNGHYLKKYNTKIEGGFSEPYYKASIGNNKAEIQFSYDYIRSALHELAHWCVAGIERRNQDDFGYWYAPDGRNQKQQNEFYQVEIKPQAIEWAFSIVCGIKFEASVDNLGTQVDGVITFENNVAQQLKLYCQNGFNKRVDEILKLVAKQQKIDDYCDKIVSLI